MARQARNVLSGIIRDYDYLESTPKSFQKAAALRIAAARILVLSDLKLDAVYLGGYAAECSLKSLILRWTPRKRWPAVLDSIKIHDLQVLRRTLVMKACPIPDNASAALKAISDEWSTELRYVGVRLPDREARAFLEKVETVFKWAEGNR
jgi:hypothetical protein